MKAFITGITGQDGTYLTELLLEKGYTVHGLIRRSTNSRPQIEHPKLTLHYGDMSDSGCIFRLIQEIEPTEVYNLASMSQVSISFDNPEYTGDICALGTVRLLEAIRQVNKNIKFYQAGSSEMFGDGSGIPKQNENTPFHPRSPYAISKLYSYWTTRNYREAYNLFAVNGILFNHTSHRRGDKFVEKKIVKGAVAISQNKQECLYLGNLYSCRDIGYAKDFVYSMWLMLQQEEPNDYVISTGTTHQIKSIVNKVFEMVNLPLKWYGQKEREYAVSGGKTLVRVDPCFYRPTEVANLCGDSSKALQKLGWRNTHSLEDILQEMITNEQKHSLKRNYN